MEITLISGAREPFKKILRIFDMYISFREIEMCVSGERETNLETIKKTKKETSQTDRVQLLP